jgi:2-dehydropantoate 2-reductase
MRFAVVGSGGVGGYFGGRLAQAGHDVTFVARGAHLSAIRERGLRVESTEGDFVVEKARATDDTAAVGEVEVVLLAVKTWQVKDAAIQLRPMLGEGSSVLTLQNGVQAPDEVAAACGARRVIPGVCRLMSYVAEPGLIRHAGVRPRVDLGETSGEKSARVLALHAALDGCQGVAAKISDDIRAALWDKFLFIAPFSAVGAVTRQPAGAWRHVPETRAMLGAAMAEVAALARARGVTLPEDAVERTIGFTDRLPEDATASMQRDLLDGKPSELEAQTGAIVRLARECGVPVPANTFLYAALRPGEERARATPSAPAGRTLP